MFCSVFKKKEERQNSIYLAFLFVCFLPSVTIKVKLHILEFVSFLFLAVFEVDIFSDNFGSAAVL